MIYEKSRVIQCERLAEGIYSIILDTRCAPDARPGQFVMIGTQGEGHLLMRPLSICGADAGESLLRIVFRTAGYGTTELSRAAEGSEFSLMGPLGNGFPLEAAGGKKKIALVGGGIGAPPLLFLAGELRRRGALPEEITAVLGYRSREAGLFLADEFSGTVRTVLSTDDGSAGVKGTVMDAIRENDLLPDLIYACGPLPMLRAVKRYAEEKEIPAYLSLEERMACGAGACLGCVVKTRSEDSHSRVKNARVCTEGPVFAAEEVDI